jgi:hypothetical protein
MIDFVTEGSKRATVKIRARDYEGNLIGKRHPNPDLDQREYIIEYEDGTSERMLANVIAANLYSHLDGEGNVNVYSRTLWTTVNVTMQLQNMTNFSSQNWVCVHQNEQQKDGICA